MTRFLPAALALAVALPAFAQVKTPKKEPVVYKQQTNIDMTNENEEVIGEFQRPGGDIIMVTTGLRHTSLVKPRADFINEMVKSADRF